MMAAIYQHLWRTEPPIVSGSMHILFITGRELSYTRNDVLLRAMRSIGDVVVPDVPLARSILLRSLLLAGRSAAYLASRRFDLVFVGFYGHLLMLPIAAMTRQPILF